MWMRFHTHFPVKDTLRLTPFVQDVLANGYLSPALNDWLAPHAGAHRITITRLAMVIDHQYFGGQNHFMYAITWLSILAILLVFVTAFKRSYKSESVLLVFIVGISLIFLLSHTQAWNMISAINSSWYLSLAASAISIFLIASSPAPPSSPILVMAYLSAVVAALCNFSGVFIWLLLPILIGIRSVRVGLLAAVITGLFLVLYMRGITASTIAVNFLEPSTIEELKFVVTYQLMRGADIFSKACAYLGSPLSIDHRKLSTLLVVSSFMVVVAGWRELLKRRFRGQYLENAWFETVLAMATLSLAIAFVTQMGRGVIVVPTHERYQTVVMIYWLCICGLIVFFGLEVKKAKSTWRFAATTLCLGIAALLLANSPASISRVVKLVEAANRTSTLGFLGVSDRLTQQGLTPNRTPNALTSLSLYFEKSRSGYWFNVIQQIDFEKSVECDDVDLSILPSNWPGISVATGHIKDHWSKWYRQIPVSTVQGKVIGFLTPVFSNKVTPKSLLSGDEQAWEGYFRSDDGSSGEVYLHYRSSLLSNHPCRIKI